MYTEIKNKGGDSYGRKRLHNPGRNKDFTATEIAILSLNPNVLNVTAKQINYKDSFKHLFLAEHVARKPPLQIFLESGFDQGMIGQGRIDKAASRWRRKEHRPGGFCDQKRGKSGRKASDTTEKTLQQQLDELKLQNTYLKQENSFLQELERLERQVMANKKYKCAYLSTIKDGCTKQIPAYCLSKDMKTSLITDTIHLLKDNHMYTLQKDAIFHSDQGVQYTSYEIKRELKKYKLTQSMSRRGNCWDNAPQESFYGHIKNELHLKRCETFAQLKEEIDAYIEYYNCFRNQWGLEQMSPNEYYHYKNTVERPLLKRPSQLWLDRHSLFYCP